MASYLQLIQEVAASLLKGQLPPTDLLKLFISKSLGFGILAGSCITKAPQISAVVRARSAAGLSPLAVELETLGLLVSAAYGAVSGLPFNAYGESAILFAQSLVLLLLIYRLSGAPVLRVLAVLSALGALIASVATGRVGLDLMQVLFNANSLVMISSRVPQIWSNYSTKATGQLSLITCAINTVGCTIRIFTSLTEGAGPAMIRTYALGLVLNGTLVLQILAYAKNTKKAAAGAKKKKAQ